MLLQSGHTGVRRGWRLADQSVMVSSALNNSSTSRDLRRIDSKHRFEPGQPEPAWRTRCDPLTAEFAPPSPICGDRGITFNYLIWFCLRRTARSAETNPNTAFQRRLGNDFWFVDALVRSGGFLTHRVVESIFRDPGKGQGTGAYPNAFRGRVHKLNIALVRLMLKLLVSRTMAIG